MGDMNLHGENKPGLLADAFPKRFASSEPGYITGANLVVDGGASTMCPLMVPM